MLNCTDLLASILARKPSSKSLRHHRLYFYFDIKYLKLSLVTSPVTEDKQKTDIPVATKPEPIIERSK